MGVFGGLNSELIAETSGTVNITGGLVTSSIFTSNFATFNISGGEIFSLLFLATRSVINITGGSVDGTFTAADRSTINISGGSVESNFTAEDRSTVNISGGVVGSNFNARSQSTVNISGGELGSSFDTYYRSTVNISGGSFHTFAVNRFFDPSETVDSIRTTVNITDGLFTRSFRTYDASTVNISGGVFQRDFEAHAGSHVFISGNAFRYNKNPIAELRDDFGNPLFTSTQANTDLFTGVFENGRVFIFAGEKEDFFNDTTELQSVALPDSINPGMLSSGTFSQGLRAFETLTVTGSCELGDDFAVVGGTLNIEGGTVGERLQVAYGEINIAGGTVEENMRAYAGSSVNLFGTSFSIEGVELTDLVVGEAYTITDRNVNLAGVLDDGTAFELNFDDRFLDSRAFVSPDATLTVTLVPEPTSLALLAMGGLLVARRR